jgi:DNA integrity scanning protein DisA with diadenylate cyclase activity
MGVKRGSKPFLAFVDSAIRLRRATEADAILMLLEDPLDWDKLRARAGENKFLIATQFDNVAAQAIHEKFPTIKLETPEAPVYDRLTQAVLECVVDEHVRPGSTVVAVYSSFDSENLDTVSVLKLTERLGRLTARDLRKLETNVPLETLKVVVDLAVEIGREGREGNPVGTMFVVGDHRRVLAESQPGGFDAVRGYSRKERSLLDPRTREAIKEIAQLDGMFVVAADGTVEAAGRIVDTSPVELTMTGGLGSRHYAGAAISKNTKAIAVVVSQSSGTVRIFQNGEVVLRIEPMQRPMKWKELMSDGGKDESRRKEEPKKREEPKKD